MYPSPGLITFTENKVLTFSVLNLCVPPKTVSVANPTVLTPTALFSLKSASDSVLKILTVVGLITLTKYGSPSDNAPVIACVPSNAVPVVIGSLPLLL